MFFETEPDYFNKFYFYRYCTEKKLIEDKRSISGKIIIKIINDYFKKNKINVLSMDQFKEDAINEYNRNNFSNALYFFEQIGELKWALKAKIFLDFEKLDNLYLNNNTINEKMTALSNKILENINNLLEEGENDEQFYLIKAYCYKILKNHKEAIEIYEKYKKFKECGSIYYEREKYREALKYFLLSEDDYYILDCYCKLNELENMFQYANNNYKRLKKYTYTKIYHDYSYNYLLNLVPTIERFNNRYYGNITLNKKISFFFKEYTHTINLIEEFEINKNYKENALDTLNLYNNKYTINEAIKDLNLIKEKDSVWNMINGYYFKFKGSIYKEIIRLIPDIFILKTDKEVENKIEKIQASINYNLEKIYKNSELNKKEIKDISIPLFVFNSFYNLGIENDPKGEIFTNDDMVLYYLTINDEDKLNALLESTDYSFPKLAKDYYNFFILRKTFNSIINYKYNNRYLSINQLDNYIYNKSKSLIKTMFVLEKDKSSLLYILEENESKLPLNLIKEITDYLSDEKAEFKEIFYYNCLKITMNFINIMIFKHILYLECNNITNFLNEAFRILYNFIFSILNKKDIWKKNKI